MTFEFIVGAEHILEFTDAFEKSLAQKNIMNLLSSFSAEYAESRFKSKTKTGLSDFVCMDCWSCFPHGRIGDEMFEEHPCSYSGPRVPSLKIPINSIQFQKHMQSEIHKLDRDQSQIANWILESRGKKDRSIFIFGAAGKGKSKVQELIRQVVWPASIHL